MSHSTSTEPPMPTLRCGVSVERRLIGVSTSISPKPIPAAPTDHDNNNNNHNTYPLPGLVSFHIEPSNYKDDQTSMLESSMARSFCSVPSHETQATNESVPDSRSRRDLSSSDSMPRSTTHSKSGSVTSLGGDYYPPRAGSFPVPPSTTLPYRGRTLFRQTRLPNPSVATKPTGVVSPPDNDQGSLSSAESESTYESSEEDVEDESRRGVVWTRELASMWEKLQDQRDVVEQLRDEKAGRRAKLLRLRRRKDEADNAFMHIVRSYLATDAQVASALGDRFNEMQATRDVHNSAESELENIEIQLDREERELGVLEPRFFGLLFKVIRGESRSPSPSPSSSEHHSDDGVSPRRAYLLGISGELPIDIHPMYYKLLDAIGDHDLAREHHMELHMHREAILYELETKLKLERVRDERGRSRDTAITEDELQSLKASIARLPANVDELKKKSGIRIRDADLEFLQEYGRVEDEARKKLRECAERVERLRSVCAEKGYMRRDAAYPDEYMPSPDSKELGVPLVDITSTRYDSPRGGLSHPKFPILLSNPTHFLEPVTPRTALKLATKLPADDPMRALKVGDAMKEFGIATLFEQVAEDNKSDFINRWLLHRLRTSPLEVELLLSIFSSVLQVKNVRRWQEDVLYYWAKDVAAQTSPGTFDGARTPNDEFGIGSRHEPSLVNSAIERQARTASAHGEPVTRWKKTPARSVQSVA